MTTVLQETRDGGVHVITLNRPERLNAVTDELVRDLTDALTAAGQDTVRAVVLTGSGRAFCSGHDLKEPNSDRDLNDTRERLERLQELTRLVRELRAPVIAAVEGWAVGAGCELALACDLAVAASDARFAFPEVGVGLTVTNGVTQLLGPVLGPQRAKRLVLTGERFSGEQAHQWGLVSHLADPRSALPDALALAESIAQQPPVATALAKRLIDAGMGVDLQEALQLEVELSLLIDPTESGAQAVPR
ncbi:enoyl-CoA hydratase/isomerase family protein [Yimella sp. cx-51]|uniref:enoyl-CoA hydratase/isomerase family protein n=1 Tax=Yimella sp. cx-51 TaxID=2770551 RepID=UPI00165D8E68|nr:enoyl-CoA hydratase/isomerase family protein [Yimella sp. cx-51]MBC9958075.1 enoyl-CoA hydratase/isomerase family protein [Yimella sp. cx-51]QTH38879.1 enoyl-CoA hydratase/isomerase family protein [Yimella sp. cx-51]